MSQHEPSHLRKLGIDIDAFESEVDVALAKDTRYWLENDTKIRAVQQGVPTYEHFRQLVAGCHLRPLDRAELALNTQSKQSWNAPAGSATCTTVTASQGNSTPKLLHRVDSPQKFYGHWQSLSRSLARDNDEQDLLAARASFTLCQSPELLQALFDSGLGVSLLPEISEALLYRLNQQQLESVEFDKVSQSIGSVLSAVSKSNQFSMALKLLSSSEGQVLTDLVGSVTSRLSTYSSDYGSLTRLTEVIEKSRKIGE